MPGDTDLPEEVGMAPANPGRNRSETRWPMAVGTVVYPAKHRMKEDGHDAKNQEFSPLEVICRGFLIENG